MKDIQRKDLWKLKKSDLCQLAIHLLEITPEASRVVSEWIRKNVKMAAVVEAPKAEEEQLAPNDKLLMEYWDNVQSIILEAYGPQFTPMQKQRIQHRMTLITELIRTKPVSIKAKRLFMDEVFSEYHENRTQLGEILMGSLIRICKKKEEWEYLVKKLEENAGRKENRLIMDIYLHHLKNSDKYLEKRVKHLTTGKDYWELASFYNRRKKLKQAVETAENGISKGAGSIKRLIEFLFDHYFSRKDMRNLQRITLAAIKQGRKEPELLERLFRHYRRQKDHAGAKDILLLWYEALRDRGQTDDYILIKNPLKKMGKYLDKADWERIGPEFMEYIKQHNLSDYLYICREKGMKKEVVKIILQVPLMKRPDSRLTMDCQEFAETLQEEFPEEIARYYWRRVDKLVVRGNRNKIIKAVSFLKKAKRIYVSILKDEASWEKRIEDFKEELKKRGSFPIEELDEI